MTDPLIGRSFYNRHLDNIRNQAGISLESINEILDQDDIGLKTLYALMNKITQAQISIADSVTNLERFGQAIKETGELHSIQRGER